MKTVIESLLDDAVIKVNYRDISGALGVLLDIYKLDRVYGKIEIQRMAS